jgi:hypothetical protein
MKINKPKKQLFKNAVIYYVSSDSGGDKHIVVSRDGQFFCDCRDFMIRHLPLLHCNVFSLCKHGKYVKDSIKTHTGKFGIFYKSIPSGDVRRSEEYPDIYGSLEAAKFAIKGDTWRFAKEIVTK